MIVGKKILASGVLACALALGACNAADEANTLTAIDAACAAAGVGAQIALTVTSSLGGSSAVVAGVVGNVVDASCATLTKGAAGIINNILNQGGTASVTVTQTTAPTATASARRRVGHFKMSRHHLGAAAPAGSVVLGNHVITPAGSPLADVPLIGNLLGAR